jgi:hypothetical protein
VDEGEARAVTKATNATFSPSVNCVTVSLRKTVIGSLCDYADGAWRDPTVEIFE